MKKHTYSVHIWKCYDEFAAMMGSEEDIEQAPGSFDTHEEGLDSLDVAKCLCAEVLDKVFISNEAGEYRAVIYEHGPRGGVRNKWRFEFGQWK